MVDATYQPKVYRKQGAAEFVVASSGVLTVETGGQVSIPVTSESTAASTIKNYGLSIVTARAAGGGSVTHTLTAPDRAGLEKVIYCTTANTSDSIIVDVGPATLLGHGTKDLIKFSTGQDTVTLISASTSQWIVSSKTPTSVTFTS